MIRKAKISDIHRINELLYQVQKVHHQGRPDLFICGTKKYNDQELTQIIQNEKTPVFVATDDQDNVMGYAFCIHEQVQSSTLAPVKTLYIDDLCVDQDTRGQHIGTSLYNYVVKFAKEKGYDRVTLNVWSLNESAIKFYEKCGLTPYKVGMEQKL